MLPQNRSVPGARLGFIGLGHLGLRIARRLVTNGFSVVVYNRDRRKSEQLASLGATVAQSIGELAGDVDVVLSCLTDGAAVEAVYLGTGNVLQTARPGTRVIELSTVAPRTSRRLFQAAREFGIPFLDVAVSGSTTAADAGTLTLFGGGERKAFEAAEPLFAAIASQWFYVGPSGSGVAMKLAVNTLLGVGMQAIAEAVALGAGLGLPRELLLDTLAKTAVVAPAHVGKLSSAKLHDYRSQFPLRLMHKDFGLIRAEAAKLGLVMPATEAAAVFNAAEMARGGEEDFSTVIRGMEEQILVEHAVSPVA